MIPPEHLEKRRPHFGAQLCGAGCRHHNRPTAGSPLPALPWSTKASEGGVRNVGGTGGAPQGPGLTPRRPYPGRTGAIRTAGRPVHPGSALGRGPGPCAPALTDGSDGGAVRPATVAGPHARPTAPASGGAPRTRRPELHRRVPAPPVARNDQSTQHLHGLDTLLAGPSHIQHSCRGVERRKRKERLHKVSLRDGGATGTRAPCDAAALRARCEPGRGSGVTRPHTSRRSIGSRPPHVPQRTARADLATRAPGPNCARCGVIGVRAP